MDERMPVEGPDELRLAAYLEGRLEGEAREEVEAWLAADGRARQELILLRQALEGQPAPAVPEEVLARFQRTDSRKGRQPAARRWLAVATAASLGALALGGWYLTRGSSHAPLPSEPLYRDVQAGAPAGLHPGPGDLLAGGALAFRWSAVAEADRYRVTLWRPEGGELVEIEVPGALTEAAWPADRPPPAPGAWIWKVEAFAAGRPLGASRPVSFQVH